MPAPATELLLRWDESLRDRLGLAERHLDDVVRVAAGADGRFTALDVAGLTFTLPSEVVLYPNERRGLFAYASRGDAIHLDRPDGPAVGRLLPGGLVHVVRSTAATTQIAMVGMLDGRSPTRPPSPLFVPSGALTIQAPSGGAPSADRPAPAFRDVHLEVRATPGEPPFGSTPCGPIDKLGQDGPVLRLGFDRGGVRIEAWTTATPESPLGDETCPRRVVVPEHVGEAVGTRPLPPGYQRMVPGPAPTAGGRILPRATRAISWLTVDGNELRCVEWRLRPANDAALTWRLEHTYRTDNGATVLSTRPLVLTKAYEQAPPHLELGPPYTKSGNDESVGFCAAKYAVVGANHEGLTVLRGEYPLGIVGYHPDDTEIWFYDLGACEQARTRELRAPITVARQLHQGC